MELSLRVRRPILVEVTPRSGYVPNQAEGLGFSQSRPCINVLQDMVGGTGIEPVTPAV